MDNKAAKRPTSAALTIIVNFLQHLYPSRTGSSIHSFATMPARYGVMSIPLYRLPTATWFHRMHAFYD